jgi:hypothetical protein
MNLILAAGTLRTVMSFLGIGVLVVALLAWLGSWLKDKFL